ncbi:MAG TPA: hypothetical protein VNN22_00200 [Verrucomicrobiae bacterium]|nr:hypothetical protein [Verrucomicrobiae bacterium]
MNSNHVNCGTLKSLHPVLKEWIRLNLLYCKTESWEDCAWWSNERASIGVLAAAVWTLGGVALEEYTTPKVKKKKKRTGRCDLYINTGKDRFACEAKQIFPRLSKGSADNTSDVEEQFDLACNDAKDLSKKLDRRLGICFVTPRFPQSQKPFDDCLEIYLSNILKLKFDAIAWCFPDKACRMEWKPNRRIYPGVILLIREI